MTLRVNILCLYCLHICYIDNLTNEIFKIVVFVHIFSFYLLFTNVIFIIIKKGD